MTRWNENGSALFYTLIAIALLALVTATFMGSSGQQNTSSNITFKVYSQLKSQTEFIRSAVQECVLSYPNGDMTLGSTKNMPYPLAPDDVYLDTPAASRDAKYIRCPGNPGNSNNHKRIFDPGKGKLLPQSPSQFGPWTYQSTEDGVFIVIATTYQDVGLMNALNKLDDAYQECEADVINAVNLQQVLSSDGVSVCALGYTCFRLRLTTLPGAIYPGDDDNDEVACP